MVGYKPISELSLKECYDMLQNEQNSADRVSLNRMYQVLVEKKRASDNWAFLKCETITDYENYIKQFDVYYYHIRHKQEALDAIDLLKQKKIEKNMLNASTQYRHNNDYQERIPTKQKISTISMKLIKILSLMLLWVGMVTDYYEMGYSIMASMDGRYEEWRLIIALLCLILGICSIRGLVVYKSHKNDFITTQKHIKIILYLALLSSIILVCYEFANDNYYNAWIISPPAVLPPILGLGGLLWWSKKNS